MPICVCYTLYAICYTLHTLYPINTSYQLFFSYSWYSDFTTIQILPAFVLQTCPVSFESRSLDLFSIWNFDPSVILSQRRRYHPRDLTSASETFLGGTASNISDNRISSLQGLGVLSPPLTCDCFFSVPKSIINQKRDDTKFHPSRLFSHIRNTIWLADILITLSCLSDQ